MSLHHLTRRGPFPAKGCKFIGAIRFYNQLFFVEQMASYHMIFFNLY